MPFLLARLLAQLALLSSWATPAAVIGFVFATSWPLMALAEPAGSELVQPANYWWYFVVTAATVGYGDFFPTTGAGHVVGGYVIVGGIATLTTVFTKLASILDQARGRRMQGAVTADAADHLVLLGYTAGRTDRIAGELLAHEGHRVVLGAWEEVPAHPMPDRDVDFVRGDLTDEQVLRRAGVHRARAVLVDARDDNEALAVAVVVHQLDAAAQLVVTLRDMQRATVLRHVAERVRCVQWHSPRIITEELTTPGIAEVYAELMTHGGANTYSVPLPASLGRCWSTTAVPLDRRHGATLLAARAGSS